ncbi:MAG: hypothetical protein IKC46_12415 [Lachnospiraceae bacterium]|nr:hypothetical protein [Lachnospiraceae bacterium]
MTNRENYIAIARRKGYEYMPVHFSMCPSLQAKYDDYVKEHDIWIPKGPAYIRHLSVTRASNETFMEYYQDKNFKPGTTIDDWGVAHEPGSEAAFHMTYMHNPMRNFDSVEQIESYPLPVFHEEDLALQTEQVKQFHAQDQPAIGDMQCTVWETAWYMRGMENLMCDMMAEDPMAEVLLDKVTDLAILRAQSFAKAGADGLFLGDDVGMQHTIMMSEGLYSEWIMPRLKRVIDAAKAINPEIIIFYHSCGHVTELIPYLIRAGVEVLNPVQPECMDFKELHDKYGEQLSFHGTIGTQTTMPFGTPNEVRRKVFENLDIAGKQGGLYVCPTHLLEPEVPVENVVAYIKACVDYTGR